MIYKKLVKFLKGLFKKRRKAVGKKKKSYLKKRSNCKKIKRLTKPSKKKTYQKKYKNRNNQKKSKKKKDNLFLAGEITHYFPKVNAAVVKLKRSLNIGMPILVKGKKTNFRQTIGSMQKNHKPVEKGLRGEEVGLEVLMPVEKGDHVYGVKGL